MKSIAELRQSPHVGLPERTVPICVAGKLQARYDELRAEHAEAVEQEKRAAPPRIGHRSRVVELADAAEEVRGLMMDHLVAVRFRALLPDEWQQWVDAHPARDGKPMDRRADLDFDALKADLGLFVVMLNEQEPQPGDWEWIASNATAGDLRDAATIVFNLHTRGVDIPKSLHGSPDAQTRDGSSSSPSGSESPPAGSTGGNRPSTSNGTTGTETDAPRSTPGRLGSHATPSGRPARLTG